MKVSLPKMAAWMTVTALCLVPLHKGPEAADYRVTPSVRLGQGWDSNIFGTSDNVVSDWYATVFPELFIDARSQNLSMTLGAGVEGRWYYDYPDISSTVYTKYLRLSSIDNGWTPVARVSVLPEAYYLETKDLISQYSLIPVSAAVPRQGIATYGLQDTRLSGASIGLRYQNTPAVETYGIVYGAARQYPDQPEGASDSSTVGADFSARYAYSQSSTVGVYGNVNIENFRYTPDARVFGAGFLGNHQFSPFLRIDGRLGISSVRQSASELDNSALSEYIPTGSVNLAYVDNTFQANLYGDYGYSALSGAGEVTTLGTVGIGLADQFAQWWSWILGASYQISRALSETEATDVKTVTGTGSIRYAPWEWGAFELNGNASWDRSDVPGGDIDRYTVVLSFSLRKSYSAF